MESTSAYSQVKNNRQSLIMLFNFTYGLFCHCKYKLHV